MKKQYNYIIVADNFDKSGIVYATNKREALKECFNIVKLRGSKSVKININ